MLIGITGIRDVSPLSYNVITATMTKIINKLKPDKILFGGARGSDTISLISAWLVRGNRLKPRFVVVVPFTVYDQPKEVRDAICMYADEIVELKLPKQKWAYNRRNKYIVENSDTIFAFWDGKTGGTASTIQLAKKLNVITKTITVVRDKKR